MSLSETSASANGAAETGVDVDPNRACEKLLSKELLQLSLKDRNNFQEEIHGVKCLAPKETPFLLKDSLRKLAIELDENVPDSEKRAYLLSQQRPASKAFVNSQDFRMRFLRCELFDYRKAAERMARVCDALLDLFGMYALERPVRLSDFSSAELKVIRKGRIQILSFRDRSGRRIATLFPGARFLKDRIRNKQQSTAARVLQIKIFMYMSYIIGCDVDVQRKGVVVLVWFDAEMESSACSDINQIYKGGIKSHTVSFLRASAIHVCSPDTHFYRLQRSLLMLGFAAFRNSMRSHLGNSVELRYILNGQGIKSDILPISWTGTVKVRYLKQWLRIRQYLENPSILTQNACDGSNFCRKAFESNNAATSSDHICDLSRPVECPRLTDIIFKKGKSAKDHPGNALFQSQIQTKYELALSSDFTADYRNRSAVLEVDRTSIIIQSLVEHFCGEVQKGNLRVLMWNEKQSWWSILIDGRVIRKKIENTVISCTEREYPVPSSSLPDEATLLYEDPLEPNNCYRRCGSLEQSNQQCLQGAPSVLRIQRQEDGVKRRRLVVNSMPNGNRLDVGDLSNDGELCSIGQCFD